MLTAGVRDEMEKLIVRHVEDACMALTDERAAPGWRRRADGSHQGVGLAYVLSGRARATPADPSAAPLRG